MPETTLVAQKFCGFPLPIKGTALDIYHHATTVQIGAGRMDGFGSSRFVHCTHYKLLRQSPAMIAAGIFLFFYCASATACSAAQCDGVQMLQTLERSGFVGSESSPTRSLFIEEINPPFTLNTSQEPCISIGNETIYLGVSINGGTPKSSIFIGVSLINHPFWGTPPLRKPPFRTLGHGCV